MLDDAQFLVLDAVRYYADVYNTWHHKMPGKLAVWCDPVILVALMTGGDPDYQVVEGLVKDGLLVTAGKLNYVVMTEKGWEIYGRERLSRLDEHPGESLSGAHVWVDG